MKLDVPALLTNIRRDKATGCLLWRGACMPSGYAEVSREGRGGLYVHRLVWTHFHGPIPPGRFVCHHCDVRHCIFDNAAGTGHLFLGTPADNSTDALSKNRLNLAGLVNRGEHHPNARITDDIVRMIRRRVAAGETRTMLAREIGISIVNVGLIAARKAWIHVK